METTKPKQFCPCREVNFWRPLIAILDGYRIHPKCGLEIRLDYESVVRDELRLILQKAKR